MADVRLLVDSFYDRARKDALLGPVFEAAIGDRWDRHLDIMYRFWQTILLEEHTYTGNPFSKHAPLPLEKPHFERWLSLFNQTTDELFEGPLADEAKNRAFKMGHIFQVKLDYFRQSGKQPLV
ncbi:hypothetical protein GCM10023143_20240 [Compostibacter hankyongensis]|uniref:Group III truncated hemoglobin n=2 Tax=Compostibacter hankyongensis TaxID=1007089 RepID=A0ABP8FUF5_9BACT